MSETPVMRDTEASHATSESAVAETDADADSPRPGWFARLLSRVGFSEEPEDAREIIEEALENEQSTAQSFSPQERLMLTNLLRFGELRVEDVMVPRADIISIENCETLGDLLKIFQEAGHSRIPVYQETLDDPRGMVHIKDLMSWITSGSQQVSASPGASQGVQDKSAGQKAPEPMLELGRVDLSMRLDKAGISREILFVPPSMSGLDLLLRMQMTHIHLALVVDEYGGTDGLVSIEDLVEEIVGEIEDEHDSSDKPLIVDDAETGLVADARASIEELEERLGFELLSSERDEDVDTLGGLVFTIAGRVPVRGELVAHQSGIEFEVLDADARRIKKLKIHINSASAKT